MFKLDDKVKVNGIESVGTIVGKGSQSYSWIVLFDEPPFDNLMGRQSEWKAMVIHETALTKSYWRNPNDLKVEEELTKRTGKYFNKEEVKEDWSWLDFGLWSINT